MKVSPICGREASLLPGIKPRYGRYRAQGRVIVEGVNHRGGQPIRFKSRENAERHIRNMGLEKKS